VVPREQATLQTVGRGLDVVLGHKGTGELGLASGQTRLVRAISLVISRYVRAAWASRSAMEALAASVGSSVFATVRTSSGQQTLSRLAWVSGYDPHKPFSRLSSG
jgi:hypothetical protein